MRKRIEDMVFDASRPLSGLTGTNLYDCAFTGGEGVLQEAQEVSLENCRFSQCSPLHNARKFILNDCCLEETALSALRGCEDGKLIDSDFRGGQALWNCKNIIVHDCSIFSDEFGRDCDSLQLEECTIHADAILQGCRNVRLDNVEIRGDALLQDADSVHIYNSFLRGSSMLQNARNVTIVDSVLKGDLIGWNCENVTLIGCRVIGMQPFCHCRRLKLVDCAMDSSELAFEYSDVNAAIVGHLHSVKNPRSGKITADSVGQIIMDDDTLESTAVITTRG